MSDMDTRKGSLSWAQAFVLTFFFLLLSCPSFALAPSVDKPIASLRVLDKNTARVDELSLPVNQTATFGSLSVTPRACRTTPPEEAPESAVYLDVLEKKPDAPETPVFHGWMFASTPALSAMEHPVYDIWVIGCKEAAGN